MLQTDDLKREKKKFHNYFHYFENLQRPAAIFCDAWFALIGSRMMKEAIKGNKGISKCCLSLMLIWRLWEKKTMGWK